MPKKSKDLENGVQGMKQQNVPRESEQYSQKEQRIEQILSIAMRRFLEVGIAQTNMSDIAKEAKISRKTLYQYFQSKEKIAMQLELKVFAMYLAYQEGIVPLLTGTGYEQLVQYFDLTVSFMVDHKELIRFTGLFDYYFSGVFSGDYGDIVFYEAFMELVTRTSKVLLEILEFGIADGSIISSIEPHYLERTISDSILSLAQRVMSRGHHLDEEHHIQSEHMIQYQIDIFLKALKA